MTKKVRGSISKFDVIVSARSIIYEIDSRGLNVRIEGFDVSAGAKNADPTAGALRVDFDEGLTPKQAINALQAIATEIQAEMDSRIWIAGEGRDESGNRYITIGIRGTDTILGPYSMKVLIQSKERLFTDLSNAGVSFLTTKAQRELLEFLQSRPPKAETFKVVTGIGWCGSAFVLPEEIVGTSSTAVRTAFGDIDAQMLSKYRVRGDLSQWKKKIAEPCKDNSRLMFAISLALTGPILRFVKGPRSGGFQIFGDAEAGKTTATRHVAYTRAHETGPARRPHLLLTSSNSPSVGAIQGNSVLGADV